MIDFDAINELVGKPFHEDGYGPDNYSCYGLAVKVHEICGKYLPKINISVCACKEASQDMIESQLEKDYKELSKPKVPCIIIIQSTDPDYADHIGTYIGEGLFTHITIKTCATIARVSDWKHKIIGYYTYVGSNN